MKQDNKNILIIAMILTAISAVLIATSILLMSEQQPYVIPSNTKIYISETIYKENERQISHRQLIYAGTINGTFIIAEHITGYRSKTTINYHYPLNINTEIKYKEYTFTLINYNIEEGWIQLETTKKVN